MDWTLRESFLYTTKLNIRLYRSPHNSNTLQEVYQENEHFFSLKRTQNPIKCRRLFKKNKCQKMTVGDASVLIDVVSNLQNIHHSNYILPLLLKFEKLLKIKNTSLGIYNSKSQKFSHIAGTSHKGFPRLIKKSLTDIAGTKVFYSKHGKSMALFEQQSQDDFFTSYIFFESNSGLLSIVPPFKE